MECALVNELRTEDETLTSKTKLLKDCIAEVCLRVCELPDRTSPDDWPEACLVTPDELSEILEEVFGSPDGTPQPTSKERLVEFLQYWVDIDRLQNYEDRKRFRREAGLVVAGLVLADECPGDERQRAMDLLTQWLAEPDTDGEQARTLKALRERVTGVFAGEGAFIEKIFETSLRAGVDDAQRLRLIRQLIVEKAESDEPPT